VITWATRTAAHRVGSRAAAAVERRMWTRRPIVRVALHPADFDHPHVVDSVARTVRTLQAQRRIVSYDAIWS
jgi:predicted deacetylase